jgi:hypothetical protein
VIPLDLAANDSFHIVFRTPTQRQSQTVAPPRTLAAVTMKGPWRVTFEQGRGAPAETVLTTLAPLDQNADPGIRYFSGMATYSQSFAAPKAWRAGQPLRLDLGEAREVAEVRVNGQLAGYAWHAPYTIDIGRFVKQGQDNKLEVRVANLWVNRLIRDADPAVKDKISWTAGPTYKPTAPLRRSGLIGPVTLTVPAP